MSKTSLPQMRIILNTTDGSTMSVDVRPDETYRQLKERVQQESGVVLDISQIYYEGKKVDEERNVYESFFGATPAKVQPVACAVKGCTTTTDKEFFRFPNESERCTQWILACHREDLLGRSAEMINAELGVCADHFSESCFLDGNLRRRLRKGSVPEVEDLEKAEREVLINTLEGDDPILQSGTVAVAKDEFGVTYVITQNPEGGDKGGAGLLKPKEEIMSHNVLGGEAHNVEEEAHENHIGEARDKQIEPNNPKEENLVPEYETVDVLELNNGELEDDEDLEDDLEHPGLLCRLCAKPVENAHFIFGADGQENTLAKKINFSLPVKVQNSDHLPKQLCSDCVSMVEVCHNFSVACVQAESDLKVLAKHRQFRCKVGPPVEPSSSTEKDTRQENVERVMENSCYDCPLCCEGRMKSHNREDDEDSQLTDTVDAEPLPDDDDDGSTACAVCAVTFGSIEILMDHARSHTIDGETRFPCGCCGCLLNGSDDVNAHLELHSSLPGDAQYQCGDCGRLFDSEERAEFHQECGHRQEGDNYLLTCPLCEQSFLLEEELWNHSQSNHRSLKAHSCEACGKCFVLFTRLKAHLRTHAYEYVIECDSCEEKFSDNASLKAHVTSVHADKKPFQCEQCGRCYTRKAQYNAHLRTHGTEVPADKKPRAYTCRLCGEEGFDTLPKLLIHRRTEHQDSIVPLGVKKEKMYKCGECDKAFTGRVALKHHMMNHTGELPHVCEFCNKGFTQKRSLILHRRTHTGEKPYGCQECGKRFVQSAHLYSHLRLHTGEKPYSCSECDATFRLKDVRDSHQRKHTGERPFKCKVCAKTFRTSHSYYQHTWIHTGRKPYPCNYCGKAFRRSNGLKVHIRIHTGEKPHVCDVCGRGFAQKQDMKKHRNLHVVGKL